MKTREKLMSEVFNCIARALFAKWLDINLQHKRGIGVPFQRSTLNGWETREARERALGRPLNKLNHRLQLLRLEYGFDDSVFKCRHRRHRRSKQDFNFHTSDIDNPVKVDLQAFREAVAFFKNINDAKLKDLEITDNGKRIHIPSEVIDEWTYIGLNNTDYLKTLLGATHFAGLSGHK